MRDNAAMPATSPVRAPLAPVGARFSAQFIDGAVAALIAAGVFCAAKAMGWPLWWMFLGWAAYMLMRDALPGGQSLGKRLLRIAVVHKDSGRPCSIGRSMTRNVTMMTLGYVDTIFIAGRTRRRIGDYLARTRVIAVR